MKDYWGPICRFALRWGASNLDEAEEVASHVFVVLWENRLLTRWVANRASKLRSLLCAVVRNTLSNWNRVRAGRQRMSADVVSKFEEYSRTRDEQSDAFYTAWVEDLIQQAVESLATEYYSSGRGDYVRVLYGRICERLTIAEVADALEIKPSAVDYYFRSARERLSEKLQMAVRRQIEHYCSAEEAEEEFTLEWDLLGQYLAKHGGLELAMCRTYETLDPVRSGQRRRTGLTKAMTQLTAILHSPPVPNSVDGRDR